jgi:hypothetical protein
MSWSERKGQKTVVAHREAKSIDKFSEAMSAEEAAFS